jgi:hypothetical protein
MTFHPREDWHEWRPPFAPHVVGWFEPRPASRDLNPGETPEQKWRVRCETCGDVFQGACSTGAIRTHIARFAAAHLHRDPLKPA